MSTYLEGTATTSIFSGPSSLSSYPPAKLPANTSRSSGANYFAALQSSAISVPGITPSPITTSPLIDVPSPSSPRTSESPNLNTEDAPPQKRRRGKGKDKADQDGEKVKKVPMKRGRKKKEDTPLDDLEDGEGIDINEKRKVQNRAAQRAFRERKEQHVKDLEERVVVQEDELAACKSIIERLYAENQALRRGEAVPHTPLQLPTFSAPLPPRSDSIDAGVSQSLPVPQKIASANFLPDQESAEQALLSLRLPPAPTSNSFSSPYDMSTILMERGNTVSDQPMSNGTVTSQSQLLDTAPALNLDDFQFDFDAPFDFSNASSVPLPPLFQTLFSEDYLFDPSASTINGSSLPPSTSSNPSDSGFYNGGDELDLDNDDEDPESNLPDEVDPQTGEKVKRLPCDKPECDFSIVSCALPDPWRPPTLGQELQSKDVWVCKQAWGKLCSHPLFGLCDVDELCHELRDKTRCSDDGRLVIVKRDVAAIYSTIPARAKARQSQLSMG